MSIDRFSEAELKLIHLFRRKGELTRAEITKEIETPWSTVYVGIKRLMENEMLKDDADANTNSDDTPRAYNVKTSINSCYEVYAGISVGNSQIKIVLLDFSFKIIPLSYLSKSKNSKMQNAYLSFCNDLNTLQTIKGSTDYCQWCIRTPDAINDIRKVIHDITNSINKLKNPQLNISAIGYAFPGLINFKKQTIVHSFSNRNGSGFNDTNIDNILSSTLAQELAQNNIKCFIDHNVKCATIAEKESLCLQNEPDRFNDSNLLIVYLGYGFSLGLLLNNSIYRGVNNSSGEYGKCIIECPKTFLHEDAEKYMTIEKYLREYAFKDRNVPFESLTSDDLGKKFSEYSQEQREEIIKALGVFLCNISNAIGIEKMIFAGKFEKLFPQMDFQLTAEFARLKKPSITLRNSKYGAYSAAVGSAISCFYQLYHVPFEWNNR